MLEQFIPNWTKISSQLVFDGMKEGDGIELVNMKSCLVGEAHHFSRNYTVDCDICHHLSFNACDLIDCQDYEKFDNFKLELFTHMLEAHTELMIKHG